MASVSDRRPAASQVDHLATRLGRQARSKILRQGTKRGPAWSAELFNEEELVDHRKHLFQPVYLPQLFDKYLTPDPPKK